MIAIYEEARDLFVLLEIRVAQTLEQRGLRTEQFNALHILAREAPLRMGELAGRLLSDDSRTTRTVDSLVSAGYAARSADPGDRRALLVSVTGSGRRVARAAEEAVSHAVEEALSGLSARDRTNAVTALGRLRDALRADDEEHQHE